MPQRRAPAHKWRTAHFVNLLENAIQHSAPGASVVINGEVNDENTCCVRFADIGSGIASVDLPHVFERFYRSDASRSRSTGGFRLGLPIAKAIIENYGGTIQIWSVRGAGTTVVVRLSRADVHFMVAGSP